MTWPISSEAVSSREPTWRLTAAMTWPDAYGYLLRIRKAFGPRRRIRLRRSSPDASASQKMHPAAVASGAPAVVTYAIRDGAQSRSTRLRGDLLGVDQLAESLPHLEERHPLFGNADAVSGLGVTALSG